MELVIFIGLQGSGKSTFLSSRFAATHDVVSKDRMRHNRNKSRRQILLVRDSLRAGRSVVVDNTNPTVADRAELIAAGRELGAVVEGYYFEVNLRECLARNGRRTGWKRVPDVAVFATLARLQAPSYDEGFDALYHVHVASDGAFAVRDWHTEAEG